MSGEVVVALITLLGSAIGTIGGIFATNKMTAYRIEQLEKKVVFCIRKFFRKNIVIRNFTIVESLSVYSAFFEIIHYDTYFFFFGFRKKSVVQSMIAL